MYLDCYNRCYGPWEATEETTYLGKRYIQCLPNILFPPLHVGVEELRIGSYIHEDTTSGQAVDF